jgi:23S rRNA (guanosine2251-2'-O)-methyltransferase
MSSPHSKWMYGKHSTLELLKTHPGSLKQVLMIPPEGDALRTEIAAFCQVKKIPLRITDRKEISQKAAAKAHQGVAAELALRGPYLSLEELLARLQSDPGSNPLVLVLDHIQDPHNLGAIIRTAYGAGVAGIIVPQRRACPISGAVRKAAAGAVEYVPLVQVPNLARAIQTLKTRGFWILSLEAQSATSLYSLDLSLPLVIVVGGEAGGVSPLLQKESDWVASIPLKGNLNSLNASVACAVVLYETVRQRLGKSSPD